MEVNRKCDCCGFVTQDVIKDTDVILCYVCDKSSAGYMYKNNYNLSANSITRNLSSQISYCTNLILTELKQKRSESRYGKEYKTCR